MVIWRVSDPLHFNADSDPALHRSYENLWPPSTPPLWESTALHDPFWASTDPEFWLNADTDPALHSNADPDPAIQKNADLWWNLWKAWAAWRYERSVVWYRTQTRSMWLKNIHLSKAWAAGDPGLCAPALETGQQTGSRQPASSAQGAGAGQGSLTMNHFWTLKNKDEATKEMWKCVVLVWHVLNT